MALPALSPDLNHIENLWDKLNRRVRTRYQAPCKSDELKTPMEEEWEATPQEHIKKIIRFIRNRTQAVIRARVTIPSID